MTSFRLGFHHGTGRRMVQVYDNDKKLVAVIYPSDRENGILVVSQYLRDVLQGDQNEVPVPSVVVRFNPIPDESG
jgi:hypothetical protein